MFSKNKHNMKKCYLAILLMLPLFGIYANDSIRQYYSLVSLAEEQICEGNTSQAALLYRQAFSYKTYPFFPDLYNALVCELKGDVMNDSLCLEYFEMLLKKGFMKSKDTSFAYNNKGLSRELIIHPKWTMFREKLFVHNFEYNELNKMIDFMFERDQAVRKLNTKDYGDLYDIRGMGRVDSVDRINNLQLLELLKNDLQCLDENVVGSLNVWDIMIMVLHQNSNYNDDRRVINFDTKDYLYKAVKDGVLDARKYADIYDRYCQSAKIRDEYCYGTELLTVFCEKYEIDTTAASFDCEEYMAIIGVNRNDSLRLKEVETINSHRYDIYLGDVMKESIRRFCFQQQHLFNNSMNIWIIPGIPGVDIKQYIRDMAKQGDYWYYLENENDTDFNGMIK
jgi:hypothetical protein